MLRFGFTLAVLLGGAVLATAASAAGEPPITGTEVSRISESFSDEPTLCQDELYTTTGTGHSVVHFTYFPDTGVVHFHLVEHAKVVAVPLDGTGPTYRGNFRYSDSENIRAVKSGDVLVEVDTDLNRFVARGSDGSKAFIKQHAHFTVNANGELSVDFDTTRLVCA